MDFRGVILLFYRYHRDPITERQMMIGVYNHPRNARYLDSTTILSRYLDPEGYRWFIPVFRRDFCFLVLPSLKLTICEKFHGWRWALSLGFLRHILPSQPWTVKTQGARWPLLTTAEAERIFLSSSVACIPTSPRRRLLARWKMAGHVVHQSIFKKGVSCQRQVYIHQYIINTVDGKEIPFPTTWHAKDPVNNMMNYQPQLVQDFFHASKLDLS